MLDCQHRPLQLCYRLTMQTRRFLEPVALARHLLPQVTSMYFPGGWVDGYPQAAGGGDAPPQPDSLSLDNNNPQRLKVGIVPRVNIISSNTPLHRANFLS